MPEYWDQTIIVEGLEIFIDHFLVVLVKMKLLIGVVPLFDQYLRIFRADVPLYNFMFGEMEELLKTLMKHFIKKDSVDGCLQKTWSNWMYVIP